MAAAQRASDDTPELFLSGWALAELIEAASRSGESQRGVRCHRAPDGGHGRRRYRLGAGHRGAVAGAAVRVGKRRVSTVRRSSGSDGRGCVRSSPARTCYTASGYVVEKRRVDARTHLRIAHEMLTAIGMEAFAERARRELVATGATVRKRTVETSHDLTPHEMQIAQLACDGLSNPEIGARLFISPRTVEWHLRHVFGKLGIRGRIGLHDALASRGQDAASV